MKASRLAANLLQCTRTSQTGRSSTPTLLSHGLPFPSKARVFSSSQKRRLDLEHDSEIDDLIANIAPIKAAEEVQFPSAGEGQNGFEDSDTLPEINARLVPVSPSYFSGSPVFTDDFLRLREVLRKYSNVPTVKPGEQPRVAWRSHSEYKGMIGEAVPNSKYSKILAILHRLNLINPALMPKEVKTALVRYKRDIDPFLNKAKPIEVDRFGIAKAAGRRKSSSAQAQVVEGTGEVFVNGKPLNESFARIHDRESVIWALKVTDRIDKYNVWAKVTGGGTTGQAESLALAVSKALIAHEPLLKPALRRAGVVTRDPRRVERKKPGRLKARKAPQWVKR